MEKTEIDTPNGKRLNFEKSTFVFEDKIGRKEKEELFLELFQGLQIKTDKEKYPNSVFYFDGGKVMLELRKNKLNIKYEDIWWFFENRFSMSYSEIRSFIKEMVEKHFDWRGVTSFQAKIINFLFNIEFNCEELTINDCQNFWSNEIEKHFND